MKKIKGIVIAIISCTLSISAFAFDWMPERREAKGDFAFGWLVAPTPFSISGIGSAIPVFGMLSNVYSRTDLIMIDTLPGGAIDLQGVYVNQLPFFNDHFLFTLSYQENLMVNTDFTRGADSIKDEGIYQLNQTKTLYTHLKYFFYKRRFEFFVEVAKSQREYKMSYDYLKNDFEYLNRAEEISFPYYFGGKMDFTDNRLDPHIGWRLAFKHARSNPNQNVFSDYTVTDYNLTGFIPFFDRDVLTLNLFSSTARVTRAGITDKNELKKLLGLNCIAATNPDACAKTESQIIENRLLTNQYGTSTYLGGPNRLRAYDMFRFTGSRTSFIGAEYRLNFSSVVAPVNWYLLGGLKTIMQLAFFAEAGTATDNPGDQYKNFKPSAGVGLRAIISGLVYRFDLSSGDEGLTTTLFLDYPMDIIFLTN
ncbi:MAG: hypothetical protein OEY59_02135 [Deltaproteobacteria bacterium]|nr:hypothetical protein [Deltaproteobacteria bacterium]